MVAKDSMKNAAISSNGVPDILVTHHKKIKLVVVKREKFDQDKAQDLILMINFIEWRFYRYKLDSINYTIATINDVAFLERDVKIVLGIVCNMLNVE